MTPDSPIEPAPRRIRAGDQERDAVLDVLAAAHASGRLDPIEVDERQTIVVGSKFLDELLEPIADLPEGAELTQRIQRQLGTGPTGTGAFGAGPIVPARTSGAGEVVPARAGFGPEENSVAILSGREIEVAPGTPAVRSCCVMGGDDLYLTDAFGPGVEITVDCYALMGGNTIYVPGGVRIIDRTVNVLAGNDIKKGARGDGSNGTLVLTGFSLMAGHDVKIDPGWARAISRS
ncbi:DUF1707 domain-containing protein [Nocardia zapadnayensis]|nr:DUF1707 domain-containing protein [Nocardia zapadnayensis]MCX0277162.1 DUF1707 domain-containing protein [Nocardia zapadnayensis]